MVNAFTTRLLETIAQAIYEHTSVERRHQPPAIAWDTLSTTDRSAYLTAATAVLLALTGDR